jgi:hypothetical protein
MRRRARRRRSSHRQDRLLSRLGPLPRSPYKEISIPTASSTSIPTGAISDIHALDFETLAKRDRRALANDVGVDAQAGLEALRDTIEAVLPPGSTLEQMNGDR